MFEAKQVVDMLNPAPGAHILDLATHHGDTAIALAEAGCVVTAVDSSAKAIEKCNEILREKNISTITAQIMNAEQLSFNGTKFDGVTCRMAMHHFDNVPLTLRQIAGVLKENAPMVIGETLSPDDRSLGEFMMLIGRLRDSTFKTIFTLDDWKQLLLDNGLKMIDYSLSKDVRNATKWLAHSPLSDEQKQRIHDAFIHSSQKIKDYYRAVIEDGKITEFTDDKILIKAILS